MKAVILAIGSELLGTERLDTNSLRLTEVLERFGVRLIAKTVLGDDEEAVADEVRRHLGRVDLILLGGGLGPTEDDRTRAAVARALGRTTSLDESLVDTIRALFTSFGHTMPEVNRRQAEVVDGAEVLSNSQGTAPGQRLEHDGSTLFLFPGVPREMKAMITAHLEPWLQARAADAADDPDDPIMLERHTVKVACRPESEVEEVLKPIYDTYGRDAVAVLAAPGDLKIQVVARGDRAARRGALEPLVRDLEALLGPSVYHSARGEGGADESTLEAVTGRTLADAGLTLVTAESCTGGLVAERLTRVPGSSAWFHGGVVTYSNELKMQLLGVPQDMLDTHGAVSEPVARAMAEGARKRYGADLAVAVTGIAGPGGGSDDKPVGTVHLALAGPNDETRHRRVVLPGDRQRIRRLTSQTALEMVRRRALDHGESLEGTTVSDQAVTAKETV